MSWTETTDADDAPKSRRMCVQCALDRRDEITEIMVTPRTMEELRDHFKKKRQ
jgi:hypothetical protein